MEVELHLQGGLFRDALARGLREHLPTCLARALASSPTPPPRQRLRVSLVEAPPSPSPGEPLRQLPNLVAADSPVVVLTDEATDALITEAFTAGAAVIVPKTASLDALARMLCDVAVLGDTLPLETWFDALLEDTPPDAREGALVPRQGPQQRDLLDLVARGYNNRHIAHTLRLSEGTVRNTLSQAYARMGVRNRTEAAIAVLRHDPSRLTRAEPTETPRAGRP